MKFEVIKSRKETVTRLRQSFVMEDIQQPEKLLKSVVPEQSRPYSCTELTNKQIEYAREYLNETEEKRAKYLRRIKRFIDSELHAFSDLDDIYLLAFLRSKKFNFKKTCLLMKKILDFAKTNEEYIKQIDEEIVRRVIESKAIGFLPYRDSKERALILITSGNWDPNDLKAEDIIFGTLVALHETIQNPVNQISGYVAIIDCKGVSFRQFRGIMNWIPSVLDILQHGCPIIINEIHVINIPSLALMIWNSMKPFLDEQIQKRITFYDSSNWESLHEKIPPCILPEEVGGQLGPFSNDHWASDISMIREKFFGIVQKILDY